MAAESRFRAGAPPVPNRIHVRCRKCKEIIDLGFEGLGYAEAVKTSRRNVRISHRVRPASGRVAISVCEKICRINGRFGAIEPLGLNQVSLASCASRADQSKKPPLL
jgi:hypothetical protein